MLNIKTVSLSAIAVVLCAACATPQVNPHYKYSTKYPDAPVVTRMASAPATTIPVVYHGSQGDYGYTQNASYRTVTQPISVEQARQNCDISEQNHKVAGAALGGVIGALAGKKLAGDDNETLGLVGGAAIGAAAGYGAGDMMVDCDVSSASNMAPTLASEPPTLASEPMTYNPEPVITQVSSEVMIETGGQNISQYEYNEGGYAVSITPEQAPIPEVTHAVAIAPETIIETREIAIAAPATGIAYIVQEGDTAWSLSRKSCSSPADIRALNSLEGDFLIKAGEVISLPANSCK
jgi:LysM repeat protein/uncharacterized protein YcfJ